MKKTMLVKSLLIFLTLTIAITSILFMTAKVNADSNSAGFYISAVLPKNQLKKNVSYFDLRMKPDQKQTIKVKVFNEKKEKLKLSVYIVNASSNSNGIVDYTKKGVSDETLKHPFEKIASLKDENVTVPGRSSKIVKLDIDMPKEEFDGIILGGLVFKEEKEDKKAEEKAININNVISYALAVRLSENDKKQDIDLDLSDVKPRVMYHEPVITHFIKNSAPAMCTKMEMDIEINNMDKNETVVKEKMTDISIAPNSTMPYSLRLNNKELKEGNYQSLVTVKYTNAKNEKEKVSFKYNFSVDKKYAKATKEYGPDNGIPTWAIMIIACLLVLIVSVLTLIIIIMRRKKNVGKN